MGCDPGVDPGVVGLAAPDAPGDHADDGAVVELSTNLREVAQCLEIWRRPLHFDRWAFNHIK